MTQNMGDADRAGRMLIGAALSIAYFVLMPGNAAMIVGLVAVDLLGTSLMGWSPLYFVMRRSTRSDKDARPFPRP